MLARKSRSKSEVRSTAVSSASASTNCGAGAEVGAEEVADAGASEGVGVGVGGAFGAPGAAGALGATCVTGITGVTGALCDSAAHALPVTHTAKHATTVRRTITRDIGTRTESPRIVCFEHAMSKTIRASVKPGSARVQ
jgi:hypothetical protein